MYRTHPIFFFHIINPGKFPGIFAALSPMGIPPIGPFGIKVTLVGLSVFMDFGTNTRSIWGDSGLGSPKKCFKDEF